MALAMNQNVAQAVPGATVEVVLRDELVHGDALIGTIAPILRHLLASDEHSVFSDEVIARVRGIMEHVASQLLDARATAAGLDERPEHRRDEIEALKDGFVAHGGFLSHVHALAMEWQLAERLHARLALDPVLTPLLQALVASSEPTVAANAMALLAAQARFVQNQRRMQLPLNELPGDILHAALIGLRTLAGENEQAQVHAADAERTIRANYDESRSRLGLIARIVAGMGGGASAALSVTHAGVAIFATALAMASGQSRDMAVLSTNEGQLGRFALALRASGLRQDAVVEMFASLHPDISLPEGFETLGPDRAAALLAHSAVYPGV
jgi:hypothetical protein